MYQYQEIPRLFVILPTYHVYGMCVKIAQSTETGVRNFRLVPGYEKWSLYWHPVPRLERIDLAANQQRADVDVRSNLAHNNQTMLEYNLQHEGTDNSPLSTGSFVNSYKGVYCNVPVTYKEACAMRTENTCLCHDFDMYRTRIEGI